MSDCIFCKIALGEIPSDKIYEDDHTLAFLDIEPRSPGHTLVIPKVHAENISDMKVGEVAPFFEATQRVVDMIKKGLEPDGFTMGMNYGRVAGQEVDHMHFHIMPRWSGDAGNSLQSVVANSPKEDTKTILKKIKSTKKNTES
jgi:histidine triad (HIT) family protein